ncbi:MAG: segregation/condensation protein A [Acidobacteriota bacterium]|nr:segregation/condensation protein A [Acidobacteriota bacterium]
MSDALDNRPVPVEAANESLPAEASAAPKEAAAAATAQPAAPPAHDKDAKKDAKDKKAAALADIFPFSVSVGSVYDGPLDLLLDLIRKQDIDIYDIPIAQITAQYLAYVEHISNFDIDLAAEFIYMASLLIQIKSKMLLPRDPDAPPEEQDPRLELVNRLLEHERYKQAAQMLLQKQQLEEAVLSNPALREFRNAEGTEPELAADVIDLVKTFQSILERAKQRPQLAINEEAVTVAQMIDYVRRRLMVEDRPIRLKQLLRTLRTRSALICSFLALLEMIRLQAIVCRQDAVFGEVMVKKSSGFDSLVEDVNAVRDDWQ